MKTSIVAGITLLASSALARSQYGLEPVTQSSNYHTKYAAVAGAYRDLDLTDSTKMAAAFCLGETNILKQAVDISTAVSRLQKLNTKDICLTDTYTQNTGTCTVTANNNKKSDCTDTTGCIFVPKGTKLLVADAVLPKCLAPDLTVDNACTATAGERDTQTACEGQTSGATDGGKCVFVTAGSCTSLENLVTVDVSTPAATGVVGCAQLVPFYVSVRDGLVSSIAGALRAFDDNTGTQEDLNILRKSVEEAQKNAHDVEEFCEDISASVRINRNTFHAYTSAWANIKFGDGTLSKARMLRAADDISHQDVVVSALKSIEHEPEVVLALLA